MLTESASYDEGATMTIDSSEFIVIPSQKRFAEGLLVDFSDAAGYGPGKHK